MLLPNLWKVISTDNHFVLHIPLTYNKYSKDNVSEVKYPLIVSSSFEVEPRVESWERVGQYSSSKKKLENHLTPFLFSIKWKLFLWHCKKIHFCWIRNNISSQEVLFSLCFWSKESLFHVKIFHLTGLFKNCDKYSKTTDYINSKHFHFSKLSFLFFLEKYNELRSI